jgi:hypothetical protein
VLRRLIESKVFIIYCVASAVWTTAWIWKPFPGDDELLQLILLEKPVVFYAIEWTYTAMCFMTPYIVVLSWLTSS